MPVGAVVAFVLTFVHRAYAVPVGASPLPLGLIAAVAVLVALVVGIRLAFEDRAVALAGAVGALVAIGALLFVAPGRAEIFQNDVISSTWIAAPAIAAVVALLIRPRRGGTQTPTD